jgi:hypothetical protein
MLNPNIRFNLQNLKLGNIPKVLISLGMIFLIISLFTETYRKYLYFATFVCWSFVGVEGYKQYQVYKQNPPMICELTPELKDKPEEEAKEILASFMDLNSVIDCKLGPFEFKQIKIRDLLLLIVILVVSFILWQWLIVSKKPASAPAPVPTPAPQIIGYPFPFYPYPTGLLPKPSVTGPLSIKEKVDKAIKGIEDKVQIPAFF